MRDDEKSTNAINLTPLVDVSLTLVLVFMVTMPLSVLHGVTVRRDVLREYGLSTPQNNVRVHLTNHGLYVKDEKGKDQPIDYKEFGVVLRQLLQISAEKTLILQIDRDVPHGQTVWVLDIGKQNGADNISIMEGA